MDTSRIERVERSDNLPSDDETNVTKVDDDLETYLILTNNPKRPSKLHHADKVYDSSSYRLLLNIPVFSYCGYTLCCNVFIQDSQM